VNERRGTKDERRKTKGEIFLAFYDKAGHNFIGIGGTNNFDAYEIATTDYID